MIGLHEGRLLACVRRHAEKLQWYPCWVELGWVDPQSASHTPCLKLPSYDDRSYAGSLWHDGLLWISCCACHERCACQADAYLANVSMKIL